MIKVDKGLTRIKGDIPGIIAEGVIVLRSIHSLVVEQFGKKAGDAIYKQMFELAESESVETNENSNVKED